MSCPSIWATLSALLINILLGSFQLFLHIDELWGKVIPLNESWSGRTRIVCNGGDGDNRAMARQTADKPTTTSGNIRDIIFSFSIS